MNYLETENTPQICNHPHKWLDDDTDEPNIYGQVVWKINGLRVRFDGEVMSVWDRDAKRFTIRAEL
jgi:hypothetical protein